MAGKDADLKEGVLHFKLKEPSIIQLVWGLTFLFSTSLVLLAHCFSTKEE
jgi:hypothetical protein